MARLALALALIAAVLIVVAVALVVLGGRKRTAGERARTRELQQTNLRLQQLVGEIRSEVTVQLAAGNTSFEHVLSLISEHDRKELTL